MTRGDISIFTAAPHLDPVGFRAALEFTTRNTGFRMDLIEKDYYCSLVLAFLYALLLPTFSTQTFATTS